MAFLLGSEHARVDMPTRTVLNDVSIGVEDGDRIGIVGSNGDGKSTLLRLFRGDVQPDEGRVIRTNGIRVGALEQDDALDEEATVQACVVGDRPEFEWASDGRIRAIIAGLLFDVDRSAKIRMLSGGQRRRVDLARVLVGHWDVLMLDEPTNHLDMKTITWFADHLQRYWRSRAGALLIVSHDRWFLDEVCTTTWEVHDGRIDSYQGGFSAYIMQRVERQREAAVREQKRQNLLRRELAWLSRGARARATKPKFHVAVARELIADVPELRDPPELKRRAMARIGKDVVELLDVSVIFDGKAVLDHVDWLCGPGDRIGIVGENGAGKTTLINVIQGVQAPTSGRVKIGATVKFATLSQRLDNLREFYDDRVREVVSRYSHRRMMDGKDTTPSKLLEDLGFDKADLNEHVRDLSGGQKRRLALMLIMMEEANVMILDEPGNDLDIDMLAALEDLLDGWPGTLLLITHDRNLMERVTDMQYGLVEGKLRHLPGGIDEYLRLANETSAQEGSAKGTEGAAWSTQAHRESGPSSQAKSGLSNNEQRALKKLMASNEKKIATLEGRISAAQAALDEVDPTDFEALLAQQEEIAALKRALEELEMEWMEAAEALG